MLSGTKPFEDNDRLTAKGYQGSVEDIARYVLGQAVVMTYANRAAGSSRRCVLVAVVVTMDRLNQERAGAIISMW
jgi:hypothetical protein